MMPILAVLVALGALMYLAFRGITLLVIAPLAALLAAALSGGLPLLSAYTQIFMASTGDFVVRFFPLFLLGAVFGKLMDDSGSARSIAEGVIAALGPGQAILAVVLCCAVLTYGGVSLFVVAFAIYPIAAVLFRDARIPKRLIPGALALGAFTFTMSALPGTPAIQNAIPMPFFGTTAFAAPGLGVVAGAVMFGLGMVWLNRRAARARAAGEGYGHHSDALPGADIALREHSQDKGFDIRELTDGAAQDAAPSAERGTAPFALAIAPVVLVIAVNLAFVEFAVPMLDTEHLALPLFGPTTIEAVRGLWAIVAALTVSIVFVIAANISRFADLRATVNTGADASVLPILNTASLVGFGAVIAALPAFAIISEAILALSGGNLLGSLALAVSALSALTGSASGGMSIALDALGATYLDLAAEAGVSPEALHRVTAVASGALDALPHNGAVITVLAICGLTHREAYKDIFVVAIVIPVVALAIIIGLATMFGAF